MSTSLSTTPKAGCENNVNWTFCCRIFCCWCFQTNTQRRRADRCLSQLITSRWYKSTCVPKDGSSETDPPPPTPPAPFCVIRPQISIRRRWGIRKAVALSESAASEVESFDLFILRMLSASLIFTTLFFPPPVKSPVSSISWWRAERGVPEALSAGLELKPAVPGPITARGRGRFHCSVNGAFPWQPYSGSIIPPFWTSMGSKVQPGHLEAHPHHHLHTT